MPHYEPQYIMVIDSFKFEISNYGIHADRLSRMFIYNAVQHCLKTIDKRIEAA